MSSAVPQDPCYPIFGSCEQSPCLFFERYFARDCQEDPAAEEDPAATRVVTADETIVTLENQEEARKLHRVACSALHKLFLLSCSIIVVYHVCCFVCRVKHGSL